MPDPVYVCVACAVGDCGNCRGSISRGRVTKPCSCRHGVAGPGRVVTSADPRRAGGRIIADPSDETSTLLDTRRAVLVDATEVCRVDNPSDGRSVIAMFLEGRLNRSTERSAILYLLGADGAAALVSELAGLAARMGPEFEMEFRQALDARMDVSALWPAVPST